MNGIVNDTVSLGRPASAPIRAEGLTRHLIRIVRRALRHPEVHSPLGRAVRAAAAQVAADAHVPDTFADEIRVRHVARRMFALLNPSFRDPPGRAARQETVLA